MGIHITNEARETSGGHTAVCPYHAHSRVPYDAERRGAGGDEERHWKSRDILTRLPAMIGLALPPTEVKPLDGRRFW